MSNAVKIPKAHLIMALCLPLAILLGYFLAEPIRSSSVAVLVFVLSILSTPLLMKWYHPLLIFSYNTIFGLFILPGDLPLWVLVAIAGFFFTVVNRCVDPQRRLMIGSQMSWALT